MTPDLSPPDLRPPGYKPEDTASADIIHNRRYLVWGLAGLLLALAFIVVFILPEKIQPQKQAPTTDAQTQSIEPVSGISSVAQHDAGLALQAFLRLRGQPQLQNAEIWAPEVWSLTVKSAELGDDHYGHLRFKDATLAYQAATQHLSKLQSDRPQLLLDTLAYAQASLAANNIEDAISAFERVLSMQADQPQATPGLARALVRMHVLALMGNGQKAQSDGDFIDAKNAYEKALLLDTLYQPAQSALTKVNEHIAHLSYQNAMSRALNAIKYGDLNEAGMALNQAATIKPDAIEWRDAQQRLQSARQKSALDTLRAGALKLAENEQWAGAAQKYQEALGIDSRAVFAQSGLEHAQARESLNAQLDHYLEAPDRLSSDQPLENAKLLLETNTKTPENEPLLANKLSALRDAIQLASTPITLVIKSDSQTQITIFHVGHLGTFAHREIKLRPGRYTVTGAREGYRDVHKEISLSPAIPGHLSIQCEEPI